MTTIIGILIGVGAVVFAIIQVSQQDVTAVKSLSDIYLSFPSFMIVSGGTLAATLIAHPITHLFKGIIGFLKIFIRKEFNYAKRIDEICDFSKTYTKSGIGGIDESLNNYKKDNLIADGLSMAVNGYKVEEIQGFLELSIKRKHDRELIDYFLFKTMARSAPAFGMVGTLVGLIFMLNVMGKDPSKIGPFLAVALVTTFYGLIFAHLIFNPMANKLLHQAELNLRIGTMELDGFLYVMSKQHPIYIKDQLSGYMSPRQRKKMFGKSGKKQKNKRNAK